MTENEREKKIVSRLDLTLWDKVFQASAGYRGTALTFGPLSISYPKLKRKIVEMAERLHGYGIKSGDVVCLCSPNIPQAIYALYALNMIGAICFIVHPLFPPHTLDEDLRRAKAKLLIVIDQRYNFYRDHVKCCPIRTISAADDFPRIVTPFYDLIYRRQLRGTSPELRVTHLERKELEEVNRDAFKPSIYLESGGTTGRSKIVVINDSAAGYPAIYARYILEVAPGGVAGHAMLGALPMFHGYGLSMGVNAPLVWNATSALMISYDIKRICRLARRDRLHYLLVIPYAARKLLSYRGFKGRALRCLSHAFIGADKPPLPLFQEWETRMREYGSDCALLEGYGLTETVNVICVNRKSEKRYGSVGKPLPGTYIRVVDRTGHPLPAGAEGEIQISSPALMIGYLDDEKTTREALFIDEEGRKWLRTGDLGWIDQDGYVYFKDRLKNLFKIAGHNVFPDDIEHLVSEDSRVVAAAAIPVPDDRHPYIHLYLELKPGVDPNLVKSELQQKMADNLIKYEIPQRIEILEALPRTPLKKIDRRVLAQRAEQSRKR